MSAACKLDVIIFGATGFTGKYTVLHAIKLLSNMSWGVAGRNRSKLEATLMEMGRKANTDLLHIPIVMADVDDQQSLIQMTQQCRVLVNCCGPFRKFGEPVIRACLAAGTHHVDVSAEQQFLEGMQLKYNETAKAKGVYLISACGFISIPADMGTLFLEQQFGEGAVNSVESYLLPKFKGKLNPGSFHYGTWISAIHVIANMNEVEEIRRVLFKTELPELEPRLRDRSIVHKSSGNYWSLPFLGSDKSCVMRTQRFLYETENKRPVQMRGYVSLGGLPEVIGVFFFLAFLWLMVKTTIGRKLLLKYPRLFSFGMSSHEGPSDEAMSNTSFEMHFEGRGWDHKLKDPTEKYSYQPNKVIRTKITGTDSGYGTSCVTLLLSAKTILMESVKMPKSGGFLTPGVAFSKTNLITELCNNGITFEVVSQDKI